MGQDTDPGSCWLCSPGVGPAFLTLLFLQPSARLGASLPHPWGWGSILSVPQPCEPSSPAAIALCAPSVAPLRFPWRVLTQVLLCQVFLTDHMPDLCPAPVLPNHSQRRPACRRDTSSPWQQSGSSPGIWLCHRCPLEQQVLGWQELCGSEFYVDLLAKPRRRWTSEQCFPNCSHVWILIL